MENKFKKGDIAFLAVEVCGEDTSEGMYDYKVKVPGDAHEDGLYISANEDELKSLADFGKLAEVVDWQAAYNEFTEKAERKFRELDAANKLIDDLKKELAHSEDCRKAAEKKLDDSIDRITRLCKQRDVLTDHIIDLESKF